MDTHHSLEWEMPEYDHSDKSPDWFWAIGVITLSGTVTAFIYGNYLFGIFLFLAGIIVFAFAMRKPEIVHFSITSDGVRAGTVVYPFEKIHAFNVEHGPHESKIFILTERIFMPLVIVPIPNELADDAFSLLKEHAPVEDIKEPSFYKLLERVGF